MIETGNLGYKVVPFYLKIGGATYQRMMKKVFKKKI